MEAHNEDSSNPDIIHYLGYISQKLDNNKYAEIYYLLGLSIDPNHMGMNDLLVKLYIETNYEQLCTKYVLCME